MTPLPKPAKRGPRARKRIARTSSLRRSSTSIARKARPRRLRRGPIAAAKREAWSLLSKIVRARNFGMCQYVVASGNGITLRERCVSMSTDAAHVMSRKYPATYYEPANIVALCREHHQRLGDAKIGKPSPMRAFFVCQFGQEAFDSLCQMAIGRYKFDPGMLPGLRAEAAALEAR